MFLETFVKYAFAGRIVKPLRRSLAPLKPSMTVPADQLKKIERDIMLEGRVSTSAELEREVNKVLKAYGFLTNYKFKSPK